MPIHDWTRIGDAGYHDFQLGWVATVCRRLNAGVLPAPLYAISETIDLRPPAEFTPFPEPDGPFVRSQWSNHLTSAEDHPPQSRFRFDDDRRQYATVIVTVRGEFHQPLAAVLWATQQDRETPYRWSALTTFATGAITRGVHVLVVDLFPPSSRNPLSIHTAIWGMFRQGSHTTPSDKPLTFASYAAGTESVAYVEPAEIGGVVPDMPLFLTPGGYVICPLAAAYDEEWAVFPDTLKELIEPPPAP